MPHRVGLLLLFIGLVSLAASIDGGALRPTSPSPSVVSAQEASPPSTRGGHPVPLAPGWNLVGWTGADAVADATAALGDDLGSVWSWDASNQGFQSYRPGGPAALNTLTDLPLGVGLWVFSANPAGALWEQPVFEAERAVSLVPGFNLETWTGPPMPVAEAVAGILANLDGLWIWDADAQTFLSFAPAVPASLNSATMLDYGDGVWLRMTGPAQWAQPALDPVVVGLAADFVDPFVVDPGRWTRVQIGWATNTPEQLDQFLTAHEFRLTVDGVPVPTTTERVSDVQLRWSRLVPPQPAGTTQTWQASTTFTADHDDGFVLTPIPAGTVIERSGQLVWREES